MIHHTFLEFWHCHFPNSPSNCHIPWEHPCVRLWRIDMHGFLWWCSPIVCQWTRPNWRSPGYQPSQSVWGIITAVISPQLLPFTVQTIRSASLQKLGLSSIKLSSVHWDRLLRYLAIPTLVEFRADADCAPSTLIRFLARHPTVTTLSILPRPGNAWRTNRVNLHLTLSLSVLDGPLTHILPVLRSHYNPPSLACLGVSLQAHDASPDYITTILQCVGCCNSVSYLMISLPQSCSRSAMTCPPGCHSAICIEHMSINYSEAPVLGAGAAGDPLVCCRKVTCSNTDHGHRRYLRLGL